MTNSIARLDLWTQTLSPALAEVRVCVAAAEWTSGTEVRGRLVGPRCRFATTVEVAYSLRPLPGEEGPIRTFRAAIPEPSLWEPECPFLYRGVVELWQDGQLAEKRTISYGLRNLSRKEGAIYVNGQPFTFRGKGRPPATERDAQELRSGGINVFRGEARAGAEEAWDLADSFGFWMLGRVDPSDERGMRFAVRQFAHRPSLLAWLVDEELLGRPETWRAAIAALRSSGQGREPWIALSLTKAPNSELPEEVALLVGDATVLPSVKALPLPKIACPA
jgi:Glycosyl hydrolases family 2